MNTLLIVTLIFIISFYLWMQSELVSEGFKLREYREQINQLKEDSQKLNIEEIKLQAFKDFDKIKQDLNLVNVDKVSYLKEISPVVFSKKP